MRLWPCLLLLAGSIVADEDLIVKDYVTAYYYPTAGAWTYAGASIANLGDLNGDSVADVAVGVPRAGADDDGKVFVLFYTPDAGFTSYATIEMVEVVGAGPAGGGAHFGTSVTAMGDLDGNGVSDLAVGSDGDAYPEGALHLVALSSTGAVLQAATHAGKHYGANNTGDSFGQAALLTVDWDGDGTAEVLIGAPGMNNSRGCLLVLLSSETTSFTSSSSTGSNNSSSIPPLCGWELGHGDDSSASSLSEVGTQFGWSLALIGSSSSYKSGNGGASTTTTTTTARIAVGAPGFNHSTGSVWLLNVTLDDNQLKLVEPPVRLDTSHLELQSGGKFGASIALLSLNGTTTNDGGNKEGGLDHDPSTLDLAVGAPFKDGTAIDSGAVYLLHLNTVSGNLQRSFVLQSIDLYGDGGLTGRHDYFGSSLACLGDLDGDDELELVVGLPGYGENVGNNRGGAWSTLYLNPTTFPTPIPTPPPQPLPTPLPTSSFQPSSAPTLAPSPVPSLSLHPSPPPSLPPSEIPSPQPTPIPSLSFSPSLAPMPIPTSPPPSQPPIPMPSPLPSPLPTITPLPTPITDAPTRQPTHVPSMLPSESVTASVASMTLILWVAFISAFLCGCCACVTSLRAQWKPSDTNDTNDPNAYNFDSSVHDDGRMSRQLPRHPVVPRSHPFPSTFGLARPLSSARLPAHGLGTRLEAVVVDDADDVGDGAAAAQAARLRQRREAQINATLRIASITAITFQRSSAAAPGKDVTCSICLCEMKRGELVKELPACSHCFHAKCVDQWMHQSSMCPLCKREVVVGANTGSTSSSNSGSYAGTTLGGRLSFRRGEQGRGASDRNGANARAGEGTEERAGNQQEVEMAPRRGMAI